MSGHAGEGRHRPSSDLSSSAQEYLLTLRIMAGDGARITAAQVARKLGSINRGRGALPAPFQDTVIDIWGQSRDQWRRNRPSGHQAIRPAGQQNFRRRSNWRDG